MLRFLQVFVLVAILQLFTSLVLSAQIGNSVFTISAESGAFYSQYKGPSSIFVNVPTDQQDDTFVGFTTGVSLKWNAASVTKLPILKRLSFSIGLGYQQRVMEQTLHFWTGDKREKEFLPSFNSTVYAGIRSRPHQHKVYVEEPYFEFGNHHEFYIRPMLIGRVLNSKRFYTNAGLGLQNDWRINKNSNPYFEDIIQGSVATTLLGDLAISGAPDNIEYRLATYNKLRWNFSFLLLVGCSLNENTEVVLCGNYFYGMSSIHKVDPEVGFIRDLSPYYIGGNTTLGISIGIGKSSTSRNRSRPKA